MSSIRTLKAPRFSLTGLLCVSLFGGCLDTASNYGDVLPPFVEEPSPTNPTPNNPTPNNPDPNNPDPNNPDPNNPDPNNPPGPSVIAGSAVAAGCLAHQAPANGMCGGFYCGVTLEEIDAEYTMAGKCKLSTEDVCSSKVSQRTTTCTTMVRSKDLGSPVESIGPKIIACIREDASIVQSDECMDCYAQAGICGAKNCALPCLADTNGKDCAKCRMDNGCNQIVPACGGFPTPF